MNNDSTAQTAFAYPTSIDAIASVFEKRSNSIANTYLLGLQERNNALYVKQLEGSLVCLAQRQYSHSPTIGLQLPQQMFEAVAYNVKLVYCSAKLMLGIVQMDKTEEFVVQSANWIGSYLSFSIIKMKGAF